MTATYVLNDDGEILVLNRGYNIEDDEWEEARGRAWIADTTNSAYLKVSFFWIFAADYKIIEIDPDEYSYAMVTSNSKEYLWILNRKSIMADEIYMELVNKADSLGFDTGKLYKVRHDEEL